MNLIDFCAFFILIYGLQETQGQDPMSQDYRYTNGIAISLQGYKLNGFRYKTLYSLTMITCGQRCLADFPKCLSYNYYGSIGQEKCELNTKGVRSVAEGMAGNDLQQEPKAVFVQAQAPSLKYPNTCADHYHSGIRVSGLYHIRHNDKYYMVYCDFNSESKKVYTLVGSFTFKNKGLRQILSVPYSVSDPLSEDEPNWEAYRLSLARMQYIRDRSTHWRITCNFPQEGLRYVDYVRAKFSDTDLLSFDGVGICLRMEFIHVINHQCTDCTSAWWQQNGFIFHHDITAAMCDFGATAGASNSQDVFGFYVSVNTNFRCCNSDTSNTGIWFGIDV